MFKTCIARIAWVLLPVSLAGCNLDQRFVFSAEERINAAFPVSDAARHGKEALLALTPEKQRKDLEREFATRMKLRALNCAKSYSPGWLTSADEIRSKIDNPACFAEADDAFARWSGMRHVGLLLQQPALKPIPEKAPAFIVADEFIQSAHFAEQAGVALIETSQSIQLLSFDSARPLIRESKGQTAVGTLSPNGRLFTTSEGGLLKIRDSQTAAVVLELKSTQASTFNWLDERTAFLTRNDVNKSFLLDFVTGTEIPLPMVSIGTQRAARVPDAANQYVLFSWRAITKIEVQRDKPEPEVKLLAERPVTNVSWSSNMSGPLSGGTQFFSAQRQLTTVALSTLDINTVTFEPLTLQSGLPTADSDRLLLPGIYGGGEQRDLIYSISNQTLTPVDRTKLTSQRYLYIPSLHRSAVIDEKKIAVLDELPTLTPAPLTTYLAEALDAANRRKMEAFERQQQSQTAQDGTMLARPVAGGVNSVVSQLARDAQIEAVGVYQGANNNPSVSITGGRGKGRVMVRVRRSAKPIVLVLSSYEAVRWIVTIEPGAQLAAVLVSGYYPSEVFGPGLPRVYMTGSTYAYKLGTPEYGNLNQETMRWTGKSITVFQGRYEGSSFSVGG